MPPAAPVDAVATIVDLRNGLASVRCERVRFVGFDARPHGSYVFVAGPLALHCVDCRFEGGYGNYPSRGRLLRMDSALVARFDRCRFDRMHVDVSYGRTSTVLFQDCLMQDLCDDTRWQAREAAGVRLRNCRFENHWLPAQRARHLYLNVLFPDWRKRMRE